jgi:hypothetical protein
MLEELEQNRAIIKALEKCHKESEELLKEKI